MSTEIIELENRVFEFTCTPGAEVPGIAKRTYKVKLLSGPELTDEEWGRVKEFVVRKLIESGSQVHRVGVVRD